MSRSSRAGRFRWYVLAESSSDWKSRGSPKDDGYGLFFSSSISRNGANAQLWLRCFNRNTNCVFTDKELAERALLAPENQHLLLYSFPDVYRSIHPFADSLCYSRSFSSIQKAMRDAFIFVEAASFAVLSSKNKALKQKKKKRQTKLKPSKSSTQCDGVSEGATLSKRPHNTGKKRDKRATTKNSVLPCLLAPEDTRPDVDPRSNEHLLSLSVRVTTENASCKSSLALLSSPLIQRWKEVFGKPLQIENPVHLNCETKRIEEEENSESTRQWRLWQQKYIELERKRNEMEAQRVLATQEKERERKARQRRHLEAVAETTRLLVLEKEKRQKEEQIALAEEIQQRRRAAREKRENTLPIVDLLEQTMAMKELECVLFSSPRAVSPSSLQLSASKTTEESLISPFQKVVCTNGTTVSDTSSGSSLSVHNPWTYRNNSCCIDVVLMMALASGGESNVLRKELFHENSNYSTLTDLACLEKRMLLRDALRNEYVAIRRHGESRSCDHVRKRLADCAVTDERRLIICDGQFQDAFEVLDILLTALVGQRHAMCEEMRDLSCRRQKAKCSDDDNNEFPLFRRRIINTCPVFQARALQRNEERDSINEPVLQHYTGDSQSHRQSLQLLLNRDNDFVPAVRHHNPVRRFLVRRALMHNSSLTDNCEPFDYVFVYLNRRREQSVIYAPVVFQRVLVVPSVHQECPLSGAVPFLASSAARTERFVLTAVASFYKSHWTVAFRGDSPTRKEQFDALDTDTYCGKDPARWMYYDDLRQQQTGDNTLQPIGNTYSDLLTWGPDARTPDFFQKTGSLFLYMRPK